jgi:predicted permease
VRPLRAWFVRIAGLFRKERSDRELSAELESNLDLHIQENLRRGMSPQEARRQALVKLGGVESVKENYRDRRGLPWLETFVHDVRYGLRMLRRNPAFTVVAVLTLALGIGANTAIFSVVNAVLLRPLPFRDPDRLVALWQTNTARGSDREAVSPANFCDWRASSQAFDEMVAMAYWSFDYTGKGEPESFLGELVTDDFFHLMGVSALHGRTFLAEEYEPGHEKVVLLSHGLWQRRFGSDPAIVGQTISLSDGSYTVVGILPPDFHLPWIGHDREVFAPMPITAQIRQWRTSRYLQVLARLKPGVNVAQANTMLAVIAAQLAKQYPIEDGSVGTSVLPLDEQMVDHIRPMLLLICCAVGAVLLIGCANVASLLLVRGSQRGRELAIRVSLGANRSRIVRQLLTESVVLCGLGCAGGLLLAKWFLHFILGLPAISGLDIPRLSQTTIDWRVLGFGVALSFFTALAFGLAPAVQVSRADLQSATRRRSAGAGSRQGLKGIFVMAEVALAVTLLAGSGLLLRSLVNLLRVDPGYSGEHVIALQVFAWSRYTTDAQRAAYFQDAVRGVTAVPGVESAAAVSSLPLLFGGPDESFRFAIEGQPPLRPDQQPTAIATVATPDYFSVMSIPLVSGRLFSKFDNAEAPPVVLINRTMAERYWPQQDPLGKHIVVQPLVRGRATATCEVVGIVGDVRQQGPEVRPGAEFFRPHAQEPVGSMAFVVRTAGDPAVQTKAIKDAIWSVNNKITFYDVQTMTRLQQATLANRQITLWLLGVFAGLALLLAAIGIYGVISYSTSQRTQEIGVRMALGAQRSHVLAMIVSEGLRIVLAGLACGVVLALLLMRLMSSLLVGVDATDPVTFAAVAVVLLLVAAAACYLPARRAARVDPLVALRYE